MAVYQAPEERTEWADLLAAAVNGRSRWRLPLVMLGMLFSGGRRTVTMWLRVGGLQDDFREYYDFLQTVGQRWLSLGDRVFELVLKCFLKDDSPVLLVIDDTPTKLYIPQVAGAGFITIRRRVRRGTSSVTVTSG